MRLGHVKWWGPRKRKESFANIPVLLFVTAGSRYSRQTRLSSSAFPISADSMNPPNPARAQDTSNSTEHCSSGSREKKEKARDCKENECFAQFNSYSDFALESCQVTREASHTEQLLPSYDLPSPQTSSTYMQQIFVGKLGLLKAPPAERKSQSSLLGYSFGCISSLTPHGKWMKAYYALCCTAMPLG